MNLGHFFKFIKTLNWKYLKNKNSQKQARYWHLILGISIYIDLYLYDFNFILNEQNVGTFVVRV